MTEKQIVNLPSKNLDAKPLTRQDLHDTANERVSLISKEFTDGFNFIRNYPKSVTIFGGTRFKETDEEYIKARALSARIVQELKYSVFTGGGPGVMEGANRGAFEAGGDSLGFTIELPTTQVRNQYLSKHLDFYYFFSRKVCMAFSAEAYVFFPGGFGTFDELFEIITLIQTKKIEKVPVILYGDFSFWNEFQEFLEKNLLSENLIDPEDLKIYTITDSEDEVLEIIKNAPVRNGIKFEHNNHEQHHTDSVA